MKGKKVVLDEPVNGTQVFLMTTPPSSLLHATYSDGQFIIKDSWGYKYLKLSDIEFWDYEGQGI